MRARVLVGWCCFYTMMWCVKCKVYVCLLINKNKNTFFLVSVEEIMI